MCDAKESCSCSPLCKGWGGVVEWRGEGDDGDDRKGVRVVDEINKGIADVIVYEPQTLGARPLAIAQ